MAKKKEKIGIGLLILEGVSERKVGSLLHPTC